MIFLKVVNGLPTEVAHVLTSEQHQDPTWQSRWDWKDYATVETLAKYVTAMTGKTHLPTDAGGSTSPRYDIIEAPQVGDLVSYGFNGDYYPCGEIEKITKGWRITTSTGKVFNRRKNTAGWRMVGGTWGMCAGHIDECNPHF
jgi:hypothetical protein